MPIFDACPISRYFLKPNGIRLEVCRETFMDTFQVSKNVMKTLQGHLLAGNILVQDQRGLHTNQPKQPQNVINLINQHINSYEKFTCHYSRRQHEEFLSPQLTVAKMFREFCQQNAALPNVMSKRNLYYRLFQESGLVIGTPVSDTCAECEKLEVQIKVATTQQDKSRLESLKDTHLFYADVTYKSLNADLQMSQADPTYIVKCGDLQKVLFTPSLDHANMFYRRKLSTYNFCLYNGGDGSSDMCVWSEVDGGRGSDEIGSCILYCLEQEFQPLPPNQNRTLIYWCDRCAGQGNNFQILTLFKVLIQRRYFTTIHQKFLVTGHSFLPCDRQFALIEKVKKAAKPMIPQDWVNIIREASVQGSFRLRQMNNQDFYRLSMLEDHIPRPRGFHVTQHMWYCMDFGQEHLILARDSHGPGVWTPFTIRQAVSRQRYANRPLWNSAIVANLQIPRKFNQQIPLDRAKFDDIMSMMPFLLPQHQQFYQALPHH